MKKLVYILIIATSLAACKKSNIEPIWDQTPEERIAARLGELKNALLDAPYGWKASLSTNVRGNYGFYIDFHEDETLDMLSDWNNQTSLEVKESTWRTMFAMDASLLFDTYNYISILQDPDPSANGGVGGAGLQSDVEFEYLRSVKDSVILKGKRYKNELILLRLTEAEQRGYLEGGFAQGITKVKEYFSSNLNNYIEVDGAVGKIEVLPSFSGKEFVFQYSDGDEVKKVTYTFSYELDAVVFRGKGSFGNVVLQGGKLEAGGFYFYDQSGAKYVVKQNPTPLTKLEVLYKFKGVYTAMTIEGVNLPPGVQSEFNAVYDGMVSRFKASSNRTIQTASLVFLNARELKIEIWYLSGTSRFLADAMFDYTYENGKLTLSNYLPAVSNGNWNSRIKEIGNFIDWFQDGPFLVDWVVSSDPTVIGIGGIYKEKNRNDFMYGVMK